MDVRDEQKIRQLFDDYLRMYSSRDDQLINFFSADFSGFTGGGDFLVKDRKAWVEITRQDFAQVKDPLRIELLDLSIQSLSDVVAVATKSATVVFPFPIIWFVMVKSILYINWRRVIAFWKSRWLIGPYNFQR